MPAKIHHTVRNPTAITASSADPNFPALNLRETPIDRQWRATGVALQNVDIDLGSSVAVAAVAVQHTNAPTLTVFADAAINPPTTNRGTITPATDHTGRRKGILEFSATVRYIRLQIPASSAVAEENGVALGYYYIGSIYVFGATLALPRDPLYGSRLEHVSPQDSTDMPNGQVVTVAIGPTFTQINLQFSAQAGQDVERARRLARLAPCWLDLDIASERWRQWPVRSPEPRVSRDIARPRAERIDLPFREIA
jgi:hypothetical protein